MFNDKIFNAYINPNSKMAPESQFKASIWTLGFFWTVNAYSNTALETKSNLVDSARVVNIWLAKIPFLLSPNREETSCMQQSKLVLKIIQ